MAIHSTGDGRAQEAWHNEAVETVVRKLATHADEGLSQAEAERRLAEQGYNELREAPPTPLWKRVLEQLSGFVVIILIVASVVSALLGEYVDAAAILAIVVLNTVIGVLQEARAEQALAALKKLTSPTAAVIRDGSRALISSRDLAPGDIVLIESGNYVPADVRLVESVNLRIEEAALTGESLPVEKSAQANLQADIPLGDRRNTAFMGTLVTYGRGKGIVVGTGMKTQMGLIAEMLQTLETEPTPLQQRLDELGRQLGVIALVICALIFGVALFRETDLSLLADPLNYLHTFEHKLVELFILAVSLAIAAVPEGLPAVVTVTLAIGMGEMVKRHALIRRLAAVETLGSASVICSDKTGTLTQNAMTAVRLWVDDRLFTITGEGYTPRGDFLLNGQEVDLEQYRAAQTALWAGLVASDAYLETTGESGQGRTYRMVGDPTEGALVTAAAKAGAQKRELESAYPRLNELPFDSERKLMSTVVDVARPRRVDPSPFHEESEKNGQIYVIATKGAPDVILEHSTQYQRMDDTPIPLTDALRKRIQAANEALARDALRVLAVAYRPVSTPPQSMTHEEVERDLIFIGLFGIIDPARPEVPPAIARARAAGIRTIMITGDFADTAAAIGRSIGLLQPGRKAMSGTELDALDDAGLVQALDQADIFARVSPQHKMRIVDALKQRGEVVAMTGDGVNDAPALKRADIGVAMGITGTDVAKETADMVLTDDNYVSIVSAVEQGRIIYANIRKFVFFLLSSNVAEIAILFLATLLGLPHPLTAIQLLWLNLVTDGAPALALALEKGDPEVMQHKPRPKNESIVHGPMRLGIFIQTFTQTFATLGALCVGLLWHLRAGDALPAGANPLLYLLQYNWTGVDVQTAETMAFVTLSLCELFRAFTVRSERLSLWQIGIFSNRYLVGAVGLSIGLLLLTVFVPFLQPVFNTHALNLSEWGVVLGLALMPAVSEEATKWWLRRGDKVTG